MTWKGHVSRWLPRSLTHRLRKLYYPGVVRRFDAERWSCTPVARKLVASGDTVIDVGANIGYVTYLFATWVGRHGRVHALEPVPDTFDLLQHTFSRLSCEQVSLHNVAASSCSGDAVMTIPSYEDGPENLYESRLLRPDDPREPDERTVDVEQRSLDELFYDVEQAVTCIKIDVEGHELGVIEGAVQLLQRWRPALIVEVSGNPDEPGSEAARLFEKVAELGYAAYMWKNNRLVDRQPGDTAIDYFFLQPEQGALLGA